MFVENICNSIERKKWIRRALTKAAKYVDAKLYLATGYVLQYHDNEDGGPEREAMKVLHGPAERSSATAQHVLGYDYVPLTV